MKTKTQLSNRILSLVLALVMVVGLLPMTAYAAADTGAYAPKRIENYGGNEDRDFIFANGTAITIEAAQNGTRIWYMDGTAKKYVTNNGENGEDLSGWYIFAGSDNSDGMRGVNGSITMTGGTVGYVIAGQRYGYFDGTSNITITGGTIRDSIFCNSMYSSGTNDYVRTVTIYDATGATIRAGYGKADNVVQKNGTAWNVSGNGVVPSGVTLTVNEGETLTVPADSTLTNNGTIINRGTVTLKGYVTGDAIQNEGGTIHYDTAYIEGITSVSSVSAKINGSDYSVNGRYLLADGRLYLWLPSGSAEVILNGTKYYGVTSAGDQTELTAAYTGASGISGMPGEMAANTTITLSATAEPKEGMTFPQTIQYELVSDGTTAQGATLNGASLYAAGGGTVRIKVTATDGYTSRADIFDISVILTPVTGLSGEVPSGVLINQKVTLPTANPTNASYRNIIWSVVSGTATISNGVFTATQAGTIKIRATVENGLAYGSAYTQDFTINAAAVTGNTVDVNAGGITISKENDSQLRVTYGGYPEGYKLISNSDILAITGTASNTCTVTVETGVTVNIALNNCSITYQTTPFSIASGARVNLTLLGDNALTATSGTSGVAYKNAGLYVPAGAEIIISGDGSLTATGKSAGAGIGGGHSDNCGTITINSGTITASGGSSGAGIGGGYMGSGGTITVNGGTVTANAGTQGAGIGGGAEGSGGTITVNGGTVTANAGYGGAGIGSGGEGSGGTITINGGTVIATSTSDWGGAGIGGGNRGSGGTVVITGGNIKASSNSGDAIGNGRNGSGTTVQNGDGSSVTLNTITLGGVAEQIPVTSVKGMSYGINDVYTLDTNKLYFYLPANAAATSITAGGEVYDCTADNQTYYAVHDWSKADGVCARCGETCEHENQTSSTCGICGKALHTHQWEYNVSGTTVTATCVADGCPNTDGGYVTISAPSDLTYTGGKIEAVVDNRLTTGAVVEVTYTGNTTDGYPVNAGDYTASITLGGETINVPYTIAKATYDMTGAKWDYTAAFDYDGNEQTVTVIGLPNGVTVNGYEGNKATVVGDYTAKVAFSYDGNNFNAPALADLTWSIKNDWTPSEYDINGNGWMNQDFVISAKSGYKVSLTNTADGVWNESLTYSAETADGSVTFYLKDEISGAISLAKTVTYKLDKTAPAGKVEFVERTGWEEFVNSITFGLFYKDEVTVKITATDNLADEVKIEYYESDAAMTLAEVEAITNWTAYNGSFGVSVEDAKQFVYFVRITDNAGNVTYLSTDGAEYDTTAPVIEGIENGKTYYTTQKVTVTEKNIASITLNGETAGNEITLEGDKNATYTIVVTDKAGNSTTVTVTMKPIKELAKATEDLTHDNVTSDDEQELKDLVEKLDELIADPDTSEDGEKETLEQHKVIAESLLKTIEDAAEATDTENTEKVENVTPENVTPENKTDLEGAKADLEKALEDQGSNMTEAEKKAVEDEIKRIDDALEVIGNVEEVEELIGKLPAVDTVKPDDEEAIKAITDVQTAYNALSDYEKSLVDEATKATLDKLVATLAAYDIVEGDGSSWTEDSDHNITFVVNGLLSKFVGIKVDGKDVDKANYEVKAGSTIITLKASYLDTLAVGEHTITVVYTDGSTDGTFNVHAKANYPATGDNSNMLLWIALLFISGGALITLTVVDKKRRTASKR